jgi:hypothetical protein
MATLSGNKVKDTYSSLLKLESNNATSTLKSVEDGAGASTALKLSTTTVEVDGTLSFTTTPSTSPTEATALFLDSSNNVITRELALTAFDTTLVGLADADNVANFVTVNSNGNILFDAGANMSISYSGNTVTFASSAGIATEECFIGYVSSNQLLSSGGSAYLTYNSPSNTSDTTSFHFGNSPAKLQFDINNPSYIQNVSGGAVPVHVDITAYSEVSTGSNNVITFTLQLYNGTSWSDLKSVSRTKAGTGSYADSFWGVFMMGDDHRLRVQVSSSTGNISLMSGTQVAFTVKETGDII